MKRLPILFLIILLSFQSYSQKWVQVWGDEFNTPGLPDSTKWDYEIGKLRNNELQYYTYERAENARIEDSVLILETRKESFMGADYTSADLRSKFKGDWLYGKFEFSAKVPGGKGTWPAIWMMPTDEEYGGWPKSGEIDIMEYVGMNPSNLYFTAHYEGSDGTGHQSSGYSISTIEPYNKFIKFTLEWSPTDIKWFADDKLYFTYSKKGDDPRVWPFNKMYYLILNLAYGGSWGGQQGIDDTKLPHQFLIDYVRVYQHQDSDGPYSINVNPGDGGTAEVSPNQPDYPDGTAVMLTAKPDSGYVFDKWLHLSSANPVQIEMVKNWDITPLFVKKNEIILNGDFSQGLKNWDGLYFYSPSTTAATESVIDSVYVVNITKPGTANWHIVGQQMNVPLINGTSYNISFDAWAENSKTMDVFLSKNHDDYAAYYSTVKSVTTTKQRFTWSVKMLQPTDLNCRFGFGIGQFTGKVYIDNVSVEIEVATGTSVLADNLANAFSVFPNPASGFLEIVSRNSEKSPVTIGLYNLQGQLVSVLIKAQALNMGQTLRIDLKDQHISKGVYLIGLSSEMKHSTQKIVLN